MPSELRQPRRMSLATRRVIQALLDRHDDELYGLEVSNEVGLSRSAVSTILRRLEDYGWVTSRPEHGNSRLLGRPLRRYHQLTPAGRTAARDALTGRKNTPLRPNRKEPTP